MAVRQRSIYDAVPNLPTEICRLIGQYEPRPHTWNDNRLRLKSTVRSRTDATEITTSCDCGSGDGWHVFVSESSLRDADLEFSVEFDSDRLISRKIAIGFTASDSNRLHDRVDCLMDMPNDLFIGYRGTKTISLFHRDQITDKIVLIEPIPKRIRIWFVADPVLGIITARLSAAGSIAVDGPQKKVMDTESMANLRPCVAICGTMTAVARSGIRDDVPTDRPDFII